MPCCCLVSGDKPKMRLLRFDACWQHAPLIVLTYLTAVWWCAASLCGLPWSPAAPCNNQIRFQLFASTVPPPAGLHPEHPFPKAGLIRAKHTGFLFFLRSLDISSVLSPWLVLTACTQRGAYAHALFALCATEGTSGWWTRFVIPEHHAHAPLSRWSFQTCWAKLRMGRTTHRPERGGRYCKLFSVSPSWPVFIWIWCFPAGMGCLGFFGPL